MKKEYLIYKLSEEMKEATRIDNELFPKFDVKRGLRNDGTCRQPEYSRIHEADPSTNRYLRRLPNTYPSLWKK